MSIYRSIIVSAVTLATGFAQEGTPVPVPAEPKPTPENTPQIRVTRPLPICESGWLGMRLTKPDATIAAQIPSLPVGVGFVVKAIDPGGPAESAKLEPFDVVWKYDDQLLVNEAQLATLLRLSKAGTEVNLAVFRGGQPIQAKLKLGEIPARPPGFSRDVTDAAIFPGDGSPMRVVNVEEKTASFSNTEGTALLRREGEGYKIEIRDPSGKAIYEGAFVNLSDISAVPKEWQRRVFALKRGLDHALDGRMTPVRPPRPRIVPKVTSDAPAS
jgi:hypothetical protein